ncbi:MAG: glycerol kinase GlpK [Acidobacteriota bacterium]
MAEFVAAIDQGTTSTRCIIFDAAATPRASAQVEHRQILPQPGWVEHDPREIIENTRAVMAQALQAAGLQPRDIAAVGVTNQRETSILWNPVTGEPWDNAIVWQDTRNRELLGELERDPERAAEIRWRSGLPISTYFSAGKLAWWFRRRPELLEAARRGEVCFGTVDTWLAWNLLGRPAAGGRYTDVSNASRTMLMNLEELRWDEVLLEYFGVPGEMLPEIRPSAYCFGEISPEFVLGGVPLAGILGDQQAALVGQVCLEPGETKSTYGTGNFLLLNTGGSIRRSRHGLLSTVAFRWEEGPACYALEGSVAVTGAAVQWLRDQLGLIKTAAEIEALANTVTDNGGVYFVPAFSGLFAPYWRSDARGVIVGLSRHSSKGHLARAVLEAICYQTRDVVEAMEADAGLRLEQLRVDGGATANATLMQLQADILGRPVVRPRLVETTVLGAAFAAGLQAGVWKSPAELRSLWRVDRVWEPRWSEDERESRYRHWRRAVERSLGWLEAAGD